MDAQNSPNDLRKTRREAVKKAVLRFGFLIVFMFSILFLAAGTIRWWEAWAYVGMSLVVLLTSRLYLIIKRPDMALERAEAGKKENVKGWDKVLMPAVSIYLPLASWIVAGLDHRFGWTPELSNLVQWLGLGGIFLGSMIGNWAMIANRFFSSHVRIQTDRGHVVVDSGPYRVVRHPGYAGGMLSWLAAPVFFSSYWVAIPSLLAVIIMVIRTALEDRTLQTELPGYLEYSGRVKFRLLPGVW